MQSSGQGGWSIVGRIVTGAGQGAGFTRLGWAVEQFVSGCGIDPHPGTLNLAVTDAEHCATWSALRQRQGIRLQAESPDSCDARLFPVRIGGRYPAAIVLPDVPDYPCDQIEIIAALPLRQHLAVADGDLVEISGQDFGGVTTIIFDVDGTLLNSLDGYTVAANRAAVAYGYEVTLETVRRALNSNQPFWELVVPTEKAADAAFIARLRLETMAHWPAAMAEHVSVLPGAESTFRKLNERGMRLAIFTGSDGESLSLLEEANLLQYFDPVITGREVANRKPEPDGILKCLERMSIEPDEAIYVGDSVTDVVASHAAGVLSVSMLTGAGDSGSLSAAGTHRVMSGLTTLPDIFD
jgi:phosphoglycolate phosphatase